MVKSKVILNESELLTVLDLIQKEYIKEYKAANNTFSRETFEKHMTRHHELKGLYIKIGTAEHWEV